MTRHKKELMECARMLKLGNLTEHLEELLHQAQEKQLTYPEFLLACLREEVRTRENRKYLCRLKAAGLPARHDLDRYDFTRTEGIDSRKLRELRELVWVGQAYNLLLAGGSGTGKTYIAAGLVHEAVKAGYRAYMVTLEDLLTCLKTRDVSRHAMKTYKRIMKAQLLAIDNATLFPLKREDIMLLFQLVNEFQEKLSLIHIYGQSRPPHPCRQEPAGFPCSWTAGKGTRSGICPCGRREFAHAAAVPAFVQRLLPCRLPPRHHRLYSGVLFPHAHTIPDRHRI